MTTLDPLLAPKELPDALAAHGFGIYNLRACRRLIRAMLADGAPILRGKYVRASDAVEWLTAHPTWRPFAGELSRTVTSARPLSPR